MVKELKPIKYIDYKIYNITPIKKKYGFRVVLTLEDNTKRQVQHSGFEKKEIAEKERYKIIGRLENKTYVVYMNVTVKTYMEHWYEYKAPKRLKSYGSFMTYRNGIFNHIITRIGNLKLMDLTTHIVRKLYEDVYMYSPNVCKIVQTIMSTSLTDAKNDKFIPDNPALGVKIPKSNEEIEKEATTEKEDTYHVLKIDERKTFTIEEVETIIKASKNTPIYLHVLFACLMGLRKSEIIGIKYSDIDYVHRKLYLQRQLRKKTKRQETRLST